jgi:glutathione S-transferase
MRVIVVTQASDVPHEPIDGKPTLVYWNILGLGQAARLALACAKIDFCDVRIDAGDAALPSHRQAWLDAKPGLQEIMPFPNLPFYIDDSVALSQSNSIMRYLGRKHQMMGEEAHLTDMVLDQLSDLEGQLAIRTYVQSKEAVSEWYKGHVPHALVQFGQALGDREFVGGSSPSVADCKLYTFLYKMTVLQNELGSEDTSSTVTDKLVEYMKRFEAVPAVKEYMATEYYQRGPVNNPSAKWVGAHEH